MLKESENEGRVPHSFQSMLTAMKLHVTVWLQLAPDAGCLQEVQWTDIDYMDRYLDWTYDKQAYSGLPDVIRNLHDNDQKYMIIVVSTSWINCLCLEWTPNHIEIIWKSIFVQVIFLKLHFRPKSLAESTL